MKMSYKKNIELAISLGFDEIIDSNSFGGSYYIKNGKKWIHNINRLKDALGVNNDNDLMTLNYDVASYYKYVEHTDDMVDSEIASIISLSNDSESVLYGREDLVSDPRIVESMASLRSEGFDDEILYDLAHQMSKR